MSQTTDVGKVYFKIFYYGMEIKNNLNIVLKL